MLGPRRFRVAQHYGYRRIFPWRGKSFYHTLFLLLVADSGESVVEGGGGVEAYYCRVAL